MIERLKSIFNKIIKFIKNEHPLLVAIIFMTIAIFYWHKYKPDDFGVLVQIFIFFAILWYSLETRIVKQSMITQNNIEKRPIIDLYFRPPKNRIDDKYHFALRNIGKGVAYNIEINPIFTKEYEYRFYIKEANSILAPNGDEKPLSLVSYKNEGGMIMFNINNFITNISEQKKQFAVFLIKYKNIENESSYSLFKFYNKIPLHSISKSNEGEPQIEFIENNEGEISYKDAIKICKKIELKNSVFFVERSKK